MSKTKTKHQKYMERTRAKATHIEAKDRLNTMMIGDKSNPRIVLGRIFAKYRRAHR